MYIKFGNLSRKIGPRNSTFIIAEIGQNHQGNINIAKKLILIAKECGADCVKLQKTCLDEKFTKAALEKPYLTEHSWGKTYGEHKKFLEFSEDQYVELQTYASDIGIFFSASAMDITSLEFLKSIKVPFIKIGSGDANNFILIEKAAQMDIPLIISTGMQSFDTVKQIYQIVSKYHRNFALLQCVSSYPCPYEDINLNVINLYKKKFPNIPIGYSGHELGTHISVASVALGAAIIERHITIDKSQKGSDHKCSLIPEELKVLTENVRLLEKAMGLPIKKMQESEMACYEKLGKTVVYRRNLSKNHVVTLEDLNIKVAEPKGVDGSKIYGYVGRILKTNVDEDQSVFSEDFY